MGGNQALRPALLLAFIAATTLRANVQKVAYISDFDANKITVFDAVAERTLAAIPLDGKAVGLAFSPDGTRLYAVSWPTGVAVIDSSSNTVTGYFNLDGASELVLSPDGRKLYVGAEKSTVVLDATNGQTMATLPFRTGLMTLSPDGSRLFAVSSDSDGSSSVVIVDTAANQVLARVPVIGATGIAVTPDGRRVYVSNTRDVRPGTCNAEDFAGVQIVDVDSRTTRDLKLKGRSCFVSVAISPDGSRAYAAEEASLSFDTPSFPTVHVIDLAAEQEVGSFDFSPGATYDLAVSADGGTLLGIGNSTLVVLDLASGRKDVFTVGEGLERVALRPTAPVLADPPLVNAASFQPHVARGSLASVFGTGLARGAQSVPGSLAPRRLPASLLDTQVLINGTPAPIVFASSSQINIQVPWEIPAGLATLRVSRGPLLSETATIMIDDLAPGIFTAGAFGAIANWQTQQLVTPQNPARLDDFLTVFMTGLGPSQQSVLSGQVPNSMIPSATVMKPRVKIGDIDVEIVFSGLDLAMPGIYDVVIQVPLSTPPGASVPVVVSAGQTTSNTVITAVR